MEYSPKNTNIESRDININNVIQISSVKGTEDTLRLALNSDSHINYDDLKVAIQSINKQNGLQFIINCGEITVYGLSQEYIWYNDIIEKSKSPVITVIRNHDHRSKILKIFERIFGSILKLSLIHQKLKTISFFTELGTVDIKFGTLSKQSILVYSIYGTLV